MLFEAARNPFNLIGGHLQPSQKKTMATFTFSSLPAEMQMSIAGHCGTNDLIKLCLTSKGFNERFRGLLYRHVHLLVDEEDDDFCNQQYSRLLDVRRRQQQFAHTLLSHPEYGKYVRHLKTRLYVPNFDDCYQGMIPEEEFWRAMQLLTHVQSVEVVSRPSSKFVEIISRPSTKFANCMMVPADPLPKVLFQSATSVRLMGRMQFGLAKSILTAINPAVLKCLCLDMVQVYHVGRPQGELVPREMGEDGRTIALGATSGLLNSLTGHCTRLQTLKLRKLAEYNTTYHRHAAMEEASYIEWATFIRSVQNTVEIFTFEHVGETLGRLIYTDEDRRSRMNERFRRLILPAIVSGKWPCLTTMEFRGVMKLDDQGGKAALTMELRAVIGKNTKIVVGEQIHYGQDLWDSESD